MAIVPGMHGFHCKHCSLVSHLVSNNSLGLLKCGRICVGTLIRIPRHMGRTSNNNNKIIGLIIYELFMLCQFYVLDNSGCVNSGYGDMR